MAQPNRRCGRGKSGANISSRRCRVTEPPNPAWPRAFFSSSSRGSAAPRAAGSSRRPELPLPAPAPAPAPQRPPAGTHFARAGPGRAAVCAPHNPGASRPPGKLPKGVVVAVRFHLWGMFLELFTRGWKESSFESKVRLMLDQPKSWTGCGKLWKS